MNVLEIKIKLQYTRQPHVFCRFFFVWHIICGLDSGSLRWAIWVYKRHCIYYRDGSLTRFFKVQLCYPEIMMIYSNPCFISTRPIPPYGRIWGIDIVTHFSITPPGHTNSTLKVTFPSQIYTVIHHLKFSISFNLWCTWSTLRCYIH